MLDGKEYLERKDMTNDQFYEMMRQSKSVPTTAADAAATMEYALGYLRVMLAGLIPFALTQACLLYTSTRPADPI